MKIRLQNLKSEISKSNIENRFSLMELLGASLFLLGKKERIETYYFLRLVKNLFSYRVLKTHLITYSSFQSDPNRILIALASFTDRSTSFFSDLIKLKSSNVDIVVPHVPNTTEVKTLNTSSMGFLPLELLDIVIKLSNLSLSEKIIIASLLKTQWLRYKSSQRLLVDMRYNVILTEFDRYPATAPFILAAKGLGIPTATLVHGAINPIDHYLPIIADELWVWGEFHREKFIHNGIAESIIKIVGNPKVKRLKRNSRNVRGTIGVGLTVMPWSNQLILLEQIMALKGEFRKIVVRPHPNDDLNKFSFLLSDTVVLSTKEESLEDFFMSIDIFAVRRSQMGTDALAYDIPIIVLDPLLDNDLQNGEILNKEAGCPVLKNSREVKDEVLRLLDKSYMHQRLECQNAFFDRVYEYTGEQAVKAMAERLQDLIMKSPND